MLMDKLEFGLDVLQATTGRAASGDQQSVCCGRRDHIQNPLQRYGGEVLRSRPMAIMIAEEAKRMASHDIEPDQCDELHLEQLIPTLVSVSVVQQDDALRRSTFYKSTWIELDVRPAEMSIDLVTEVLHLPNKCFVR